jgi:hypothetical protein
MATSAVERVKVLGLKSQRERPGGTVEFEKAFAQQIEP